MTDAKDQNNVIENSSPKLGIAELDHKLKNNVCQVCSGTRKSTEQIEQLQQQIFALNEENETLRREHAEELAVLSLSLKEHYANETQDTVDSSELVKHHERELQKLHDTIQDKNFHINTIQQKLLKLQLEMEEEMENHEKEVEDLKANLENNQNQDIRNDNNSNQIETIKVRYEKELEELRSQIRVLESTEESETESNIEEKNNEYQKEIEELRRQLRAWEEQSVSSNEKTVEEKMETEQAKFRRELMAVKDKLIYQHQTELDGVLSQLDQLNAENEQLKEALLKKQELPGQVEQNRMKNGGILYGIKNGSECVAGAISIGDKTTLSHDVNQNIFEIRAAGQPIQYFDDLESFKCGLEKQYQQQMDRITARLREEYQIEQDENISKIEEEYELQFKKHKAELEENLNSVSRQLKLQYQVDLDRTTADMEEQIQQLKNAHLEEVADLNERIRSLSEERRRSVLQQDSTEQSVIVIKEECKTKLENLEQELRLEREKNVEYKELLESVEAQVQTFKAEKEQEVKLIEEELRKKCKLLIEKKSKELKERYQSELNEKVNKVEKHWRKQYDEDMTRTRCELEESNRTLKAKYEKEVSDIMIQMEDVQQKQQEVLQQEKRQFEEHQKKMFEKQLSEVKEELEPYKDKCLTLEKENKELMNKYEQDLCELKTKLDEVEERYRSNEPEEEDMQMLKEELELYREKVSKLESGNKQLVENYEAQISSMKSTIKKIEEDDLKVLKEEVKMYQDKIEKVQEEKTLLKENCDSIKIKLQLMEKEHKVKNEEHKVKINEFETLVFDLRRESDEFRKEHERNNQENNRLVSENEKRKSALVDLERELASIQKKHEKEKKRFEDLVEEYETSKKENSCLENENKEFRNKLLDLQQRLNFYEDECSHLQEETSNLIKEVQELNHKNNQILTSKKELEIVVNEMRVQLDALKETEKRLLDKNESFLREAEATKSELENQNSAFQDAISKKNDLEKEVYSLKEEIVSFREGKEKAKNEIEVLQQSLNTLSEELGNKKEGNNSTMREIKNLNESLHAMTISLENSRKEQEQVKSEKEDLSETLSALKEELKTDKEEIDKVNKKNNVLEVQLSSAMNELKSNKSKLSQLQEKKKKSDNKLGAQIQRLMMTVRNLEGDVRNQEKRCQQLEEDKKRLFSKHEIEVKELMEKIESLETNQWKLRKVEEDKNDIEKEMAGLRNDLTFYQTKLSEMEGLRKGSIEKKQGEEENLQEKVRQLEKILEQREKELKFSRNKLKEVKIEKEATDLAHAEEMTALKIVLKAFEGSAEDELYRVSNEKYNCEIENAKLKKELSLAKYSLEEHQTRNREYEEEIAILVRDAERLKVLADESKSCESVTTEKQSLCEEIEILRKDLEGHKNHVIELEEEGNHSFGVLLSQHEKELETLKEELEDQIARKREQLAKDAAAKRQKLREEYEGKVRVLYDELVAEKQRTKDQEEANQQLTVKINKLEENKKIEARFRKELEENVRTLTENLKKHKELKIESLKNEQEYKDRIQSLEQEIFQVLKSSSENSMQENNEKDEPHVKDYEEKVNVLQVELNYKNDENADLQKRFVGETIQETQENYENKWVLQKENENLQARLRETEREYGDSMKSLEKDKEQLQEELQKELELKQLLQKEVKERDSARDAVVQKYDLRMEELALELESANRRAEESHKKRQDMETLFATKQNEWKTQVDQLTTEKENLLAEHESDLNLEQRVQQLELQLSETFGEIASKDNEMESLRDLEQKTKLLEEQVSDEKEQARKLQLIIESNKNEMNEDKTKLKEMMQLVEEKDKVIEKCKDEMKQTEDKFQDDITKSANRQKELESHLKTQIADYSNSLERVKKDLKEEYEESNIQLKKNYESIFARMEEEQKAKVEEMEAEIETLKGMVDSLEQLNQLKDEEQEVLMREQAENLESEISQLHSESLEHQNEIAKLKMEKEKISAKANIVEKQLAKITEEKDLLSSEQEVTLLKLKDKLSLEYNNQIKELGNQIKLLEDSNQNLKKDYEKEIDSLQKQLSFETSCQLNLQTEHDRELSEQKELLQKQHKLDVETFNSELQEKTTKLELVRSEYQEEVRVLSVKLEELNHELETLKSDLASKYECEIAILKNDLEAKSSELDKREAEHINKVQMLSQKIQNMSEKHSCKENEELQKMKSGYELLISSLRTENQAIGDKNNKLKKDLENTLTSHLKHDEDIKADLERKYKYQLDKLNKKHAGELDSLMQKLESLIRQENASKSMTEEHMKGIEVLRKEFDKKLERITREKRKELESAQRILEQQYKMAIAGLNEQIVSKEAENNKYKRQVRELKEQVASLKKVNQSKQFNQDDLMRLRRENTELCIKLREEISRNHFSPENDNSKKQIQKLKGEIDRLKMVNKDLQFALDQSSIFSENEVESLSSDRNRQLQLIKLMEELMMEKNSLELKLREEIKDLKTRFGANIDSLNKISSFPFLEKSLTSDGLDALLSEFNENKLKQEEDIKTNVTEIENMIKDVKKRLDSTALTDKKTRNVLERQVEHLEEQRELMVDRLRQLGEKHRILQEKITRQMEEQSNKSSPGSYSRTRYYENLFEENLRREKELLSMKRKQVEDLQQRLSFEKTALEKHVADKRKFQREILEKDKLETVLSSERNELERKWIGKLKEKELELKQEKVALESKREHINSILSDNHYKLRRMDSTESHSLQQENTQKLGNASFREQERSVNKSRNNAETVHFRYKNAASPETKMPSIVDYGNLRRRIFDETNINTSENSVNLQESRKPITFDDSFLSSSPRFSVKVRGDLYDVKIPPESLDTSQESNSEVNVYKELSLDFDTGDSDSELYETHSLELVDDLDPNWEKKLEEDLKRISAGELITNSEIVTKRPIDKSHTRIPRMCIGRSQSDSLIRVKKSEEHMCVVTNSKVIQDDTSLSKPSGFAFAVGRENYSPRTSTAVGNHSPDRPPFTANGFQNISHIPTVLPNLFRQVKYKGSSLNNPKPLDTEDCISGISNTLSSNGTIPDADHFRVQSPSALSSEFAKGTKYREMPGCRGQEKSRTLSPSLFLINIEDFVDRHTVQCSDDVASLREPSPSEKRLPS